MKKIVYYIIPFIFFPVLVFITEYLDDAETIRMSPYILIPVLLLFSVAMGTFSPSDKKFDYLITAIVPLSFLCVMFIAGFLDKSDLETRFHVNRALECAFQPLALICCFITGLTTFVASYKKIRITRIINHNRDRA